jgi:hypothetical protein
MSIPTNWTLPDVKGPGSSNHIGRESLEVAVDKPRAGAFEALFGSNRFYPKGYLSPAVSSTPTEARPNAPTAEEYRAGQFPQAARPRRPCILLVFRVGCGSSISSEKAPNTLPGSLKRT